MTSDERIGYIRNEISTPKNVLVITLANFLDGLIAFTKSDRALFLRTRFASDFA